MLEISIHAAREGGDLSEDEADERPELFQSTPPVKAATASGTSVEQQLDISIHAAREGGDRKGRNAVCFAVYFNPRRP